MSNTTYDLRALVDEYARQIADLTKEVARLVQQSEGTQKSVASIPVDEFFLKFPRAAEFFDGKKKVDKSAVYKTAAGTPYLRRSVVRAFAYTRPRTLTSTMGEFLESFDESLGFEHGIEDYESSMLDMEHILKFAGQLCYMSFGKNATPNAKIGSYLAKIIEQGHGSVLEHGNVTLLFYGIDRAVTHELVRHRAGFGFCLAGDTEVWSGSMQKGRFDGVKRKWTIREIFEKTKTSHGRSRIPLMRVRSYDGQFFVPNTVVAVQESGVKPIFRMTLEDGRTVRSSENHMFLTGDGWLPVSEILVGQTVATNGVAVWTPEMREKARQQKLGDRNHRWKGDEASVGAGRLRAWKMFSVEGRVCNFCGSDEQLHRHHRDENTLNNEESNIEILCATCHQAEHHLGRRMTVGWSRVVSIEPDGEEMTYDMEVGAPHHNFVANGIVTHNSQVSQRYVSGSALRFVERPEFQNSKELHQQFESWIDAARYEYDNRASLLLASTAEVSGQTATERRKAVNQAARACLPNETEAPIVVTANLRALRHFFEMRGSYAADRTIRELAIRTFLEVVQLAPYVFDDFEFLPPRSEEDDYAIVSKFRKV